jgi:hypothetical protein
MDHQEGQSKEAVGQFVIFQTGTGARPSNTAIIARGIDGGVISRKKSSKKLRTPSCV